jgi:hypothetical protein
MKTKSRNSISIFVDPEIRSALKKRARLIDSTVSREVRAILAAALLPAGDAK